MPCHVDPPTASELKFADDTFRESVALFDALTHRNDVLREALLNPEAVPQATLLKAVKDDFKPQLDALNKRANRGFVRPDSKYLNKAVDAYGEFAGLVNALTGTIVLTKKERKKIEETQTAHRVEDLKRLAKVAIDNWDMDLLKKVTSADKTKPLEPQLGFDPDSM